MGYKHKRREQKYLTEEEIEVLKAACDTFSDQLIVYGTLYTGMRVDELCHLHAGWLDLREGLIRLVRTQYELTEIQVLKQNGSVAP